MTTVNTDAVMSNLFLHLLEDFRKKHGPTYAQGAQEAFQSAGINGLRRYNFPARSRAPVSVFKTDYQLENLFKRYRFENDIFTDDELKVQAWEKFHATQLRLDEGLRLTPLVFMVLQRARRICKRILGSYDPQEHRDNCRFGKRACVGTGYRDSYLDFKLTRPLTGSHEHISWFKKGLAEDEILARTLHELHGNDIRYEVCSHLEPSLVPKSYKAFRFIMPDTLLGGYYTNGLGRVIQNRLCAVGLDIRSLQARHQRLVQSSSIDRRLVTADLSAASDSITVELLRWLLPRAWSNAVLYGRIPYIRDRSKQLCRMNTVVTMGLGHTFPLQTLVFYSLIKAIGELGGRPRSYVSVYGDDLIYPRYLHRYIVRIFPLLQLKLNGDKTYAEDYFRESCGADCYHGCDVRPFQPEGDGGLLWGRKLAMFYYKLYNGLTRRWGTTEIRSTLRWLEMQIVLHCDFIHQVPPSYPDTAGVKVEKPNNDPFWSPVLLQTKEDAPCIFGMTFLYLRSVAKDRAVTSCSPFYWEWLRKARSPEMEEVSSWDDEVDVAQLRWLRTKYPKRYVRSTITGRRLRALYPVVHDKSKASIKEEESALSVWI